MATLGQLEEWTDLLMILDDLGIDRMEGGLLKLSETLEAEEVLSICLEAVKMSRSTLT